jgi:hypothetical protein
MWPKQISATEVRFDEIQRADRCAAQHAKASYRTPQFQQVGALKDMQSGGPPCVYDYQRYLYNR